MHEDTKEVLLGVLVFAAIVLVIGLVIVGDCWVDNKVREKDQQTRGPKLFAQGQEVTIKTTGERTIVVSITAWAPTYRWHYWCRVAFGRKDYPIGVITNPTQITKTYELVDFYGVELEAR